MNVDKNRNIKEKESKNAKLLISAKKTAKLCENKVKKKTKLRKTIAKAAKLD